MIVQPPRVQVKLKRDKFAQQHASSSRKKGGASCFRNVIETVVFLGWLIFTGIGGYFLGQTPLSQDAACPPIAAPTAPPLAQQAVAAVKCIPRPKATAATAATHQARQQKAGAVRFVERIALGARLLEFEAIAHRLLARLGGVPERRVDDPQMRHILLLPEMRRVVDFHEELTRDFH
jgi:hypothetical protein